MSDRDREKLQREDWNGFLEEFQGESDRAAAIVGAAFLDEQLRFLLEEFLVDHPESKNLLEGTLRGLTVRARAAFCLGFLNPLEYRDIVRILWIRNRFAHQLHGLTFADTDIMAQCDALELPPKIIPLNWQITSRDKYVTSVQQIATWVALRRLGIRGDRRKVQSGPAYPGKLDFDV
jgi:DNA-binding MltR family transcriptional regulator